jgi:hypothetical protein
VFDSEASIEYIVGIAQFPDGQGRATINTLEMEEAFQDQRYNWSEGAGVLPPCAAV